MNPDDTTNFSDFCFKDGKDFYLRYCLLSLDAMVNAKAEKIRSLVAQHWIQYLQLLLRTRSRICLTPLVLVIRDEELELVWAQLPESIQTKVWDHFETSKKYQVSRTMDTIVKL